jgi:hypothetical protein
MNLRADGVGRPDEADSEPSGSRSVRNGCISTAMRVSDDVEGTLREMREVLTSFFQGRFDVGPRSTVERLVSPCVETDIESRAYELPDLCGSEPRIVRVRPQALCELVRQPLAVGTREFFDCAGRLGIPVLERHLRGKAERRQWDTDVQCRLKALPPESIRVPERRSGQEESRWQIKSHEDRGHDIRMRPKVVIERDCDWERFADPASGDRLAKGRSRYDSVVAPQVFELRLEQHRGVGRNELPLAGGGPIGHSVVDQRKSSSKW